jgi:hypothetical protein
LQLAAQRRVGGARRNEPDDDLLCAQVRLKRVHRDVEGSFARAVKIWAGGLGSENTPHPLVIATIFLWRLAATLSRNASAIAIGP